MRGGVVVLILAIVAMATIACWWWRLRQQDPRGQQQTPLERLAASMLVASLGPGAEYNLTNHDLSSPYASQYGQDKIVDGILCNLTGGFFVECGAQDGEQHSNSLFFELARGWTGLLVEANPRAFPKLRSKRRKNAHLLRGSLSIRQGRASKEKFKVSRDTGQDSLADIPLQAPLSIWKHVDKRRREIEVQSIPLVPVLSVLGVETVHYFSLDVEGAEVEVLKAISWDQVDIWVMTIEMVLAHGGAGMKTITALMKSRGYEEVARAGVDSIFVRSDKIADGTLLVADRDAPLPDFKV